MLILACGALTLAALLYVFWLTPEPVRVKTAAERERDYLDEKREVVYENLRDLHLEYRMGKLSDSDYQQMKARYQEELAGLLVQLDHVARPSSTGSGPGVPPVEKREVAQASSAVRAQRCPRCGKDNPLENRFCGACGAELQQ